MQPDSAIRSVNSKQTKRLVYLVPLQTLLQSMIIDGAFVDSEEAKRNHLKVASANWHALATLAGQYAPNGPAVLVDIGSTTIDVIPMTTPSTVSAGIGGSGRARTSRSRVIRPMARPSRPASRAPARPPNANPTGSSSCRASTLTRPWRTVNPSTCSTNIFRTHAVVVQKNRRTRKRISTG